MTRAYDPADPDQVAARQTDQARRRQQAEADMRWLLEAPQGRRIVAGLLQQSGFLAASYVPGDALGTAYREGARAIGAFLHAAVTNVSQGAYLPALLAEVSNPSDGRRARSNADRSSERDAAG